MAELAQEMLDSDQKVEKKQGKLTSETEADTSISKLVLDMNNLKDVPFLDFLNLHKIYPKIFMLKMDSNTLQSQATTLKGLDGLEGMSEQDKAQATKKNLLR